MLWKTASRNELANHFGNMLLNLPVVKHVDVLVVGVDSPSTAALAFQRFGQRILATYGEEPEQEIVRRLRQSGVELLAGAVPVAPLKDASQATVGWVFLAEDGYFAIQAREVVAENLPLTAEAPLTLASGEEVVWNCDNIIHSNRLNHVFVELPLPACEMTTEVLVVGDGVSGTAAAMTAAREGRQVLCIGAFGCPNLLAAEPPVDGLKHWPFARLGGVLHCKRCITGVLCRDFKGKSYLVRSKVVIDATGDALVVRAAGAAVSQFIPDGCADYTGWGTSLGYVQLPGYVRELFHSEEDNESSSEDFRQLGGDYRMVGELVVQPQDIILGRHYCDAIGVAHGSIEDVGSGVQSILMRLIPPGSTWEAWVPLRALLPRKLEGVLTIGRGLSFHWNALFVLKRRKDLQKMATAAGLVAAAAVQQGCALREVPLRPIQQRLVEAGVLPSEAVAVQKDVNTASPTPQSLTLYQVAAIFQRPDRARRQLQAAFGRQPTVLVAQILAFLGDSSGREMLKLFLDSTPWEPSAPGDANTPLDSVILALQVIGGGTAALLRKLQELDGKAPFSHLRAVCLYLQRWPMPEAVPQLECILTAPGLSGHAHHAGDLFAQLRELYVAGALLACCPTSNLALQSLEAYRSSPHLPLAVYANRLLAP